MPLARLARSTSRIQGPEVYQTHQALDALAVDHVAAVLQLVAHPAAAEQRLLEMDLVDEAHQPHILLAYRLGSVVRTRASHIEQRATSRLGQFVLLVNSLPELAHRSRPRNPDKKSFSIAS